MDDNCSCERRTCVSSDHHKECALAILPIRRPIRDCFLINVDMVADGNIR